jgi:uncharacterized membrane protein (UPF0127 family)
VIASRLSSLPVALALGHEVRVATGFRVRLLGLAHLDRGEAGPGLLIPDCSSVHTFGMRFDLDVYFLDDRDTVLAVRRKISPRRVAFCRGASAVLEISAGEGGEFSSLCP